MLVLEQPFIPVDATIISYTFSGVPEQYEESLSLDASVGMENRSLTLRYTNVTDADLVISEAFSITVSINYFEKEGE